MSKRSTTIPALDLNEDHYGKTIRFSGNPTSYRLLEVVGVVGEDGEIESDRLEVLVEDDRGLHSLLVDGPDAQATVWA